MLHISTHNRHASQCTGVTHCVPHLSYSCQPLRSLTSPPSAWVCAVGWGPPPSQSDMSARRASAKELGSDWSGPRLQAANDNKTELHLLPSLLPASSPHRIYTKALQNPYIIVYICTSHSPARRQKQRHGFGLRPKNDQVLFLSGQPRYICTHPRRNSTRAASVARYRHSKVRKIPTDLSGTLPACLHQHDDGGRCEHNIQT